MVELLKELYETFDRADYSWQKLSLDYWFGDKLADIDIDQMLPLALFPAKVYDASGTTTWSFHPV